MSETNHLSEHPVVVEQPKVISLVEAQKTIQQEKEQRAAKFIKEYQTLCAKYQCEIVQQGMTVVAK